MPDDDAGKLLAELSSARMEFEALHTSLTNLQDEVMPDDIKEKLKDIREEFAPQIAAAEGKMKELEEKVKQAVLQRGKTVKGLRLQAVYIKPKPKWDNDKMEGYAAAHPEVLDLRTYGEATVQIRKVDSGSKVSE